jgi:hypothetical protein
MCLTLCREFPIAATDDPVEEAFAFAQATQTLRRWPAELERLNAAVTKGDAQAFATIVRRLELGRFCPRASARRSWSRRTRTSSPAAGSRCPARTAL